MQFFFLHFHLTYQTGPLEITQEHCQKEVHHDYIAHKNSDYEVYGGLEEATASLTVVKYFIPAFTDQYLNHS